MIQSLTPTEQKVASMVLEGRTNRQIAGILVVTLKAVEYHITNILRKSGVERRGDLATALMRPKKNPKTQTFELVPIVPQEDRALYERVAALEETVARLTRLVECLTMSPLDRVS